MTPQEIDAELSELRKLDEARKAGEYQANMDFITAAPRMMRLLVAMREMMGEK